MSSLGIYDKKTKTYNKIAGEAEAAVIDSSLSSTSTNPVQNKVVKDALDHKLNAYTVKYTVPANTGGWHKIAQTTAQTTDEYFNFDLYTNGGWHNQSKSMASFQIQNINGNVNIVQLSGKVLPHPIKGIAKIRMVRVTDNKNIWILEEYSPSSNNNEDFKFTIAGDVTVTPLDGSVDTTTDFKDSVSLDVSDIPTGHVITTGAVDASMSDASTNPVQNKVIKSYVDGRTTLDSALSDTSVNPVQNKVIKSALDGKSDINHTHNYAGSSSAGGAANSAVKLDTATAGSATQPVFFYGGKPVACSYTLDKSVPSNAVFTDTEVTNTLNTHKKAYVTGTTSASTNTGTQIFDTGVYIGTGTGQLTLEGSDNINYGTDASIFNVKIPPSHNNRLYGANIVPYRNDMTDYVTGLNIDCGDSTGPGMNGINVTCRVNNYQPTVRINRSGGTNSYALQVPNGKSYIATIYSDSSTITTSDREKKTDIQSISDKYEELFFKLQPRLFKFKDGTSGRIHIGAIAQEVEEALKDVGLSDTEFAGFVRQEKEYVVNEETGEITQEEGYDYYLRYEEFVMLLCHMLQKLYAEKEEQDNKISDLESRIVALESKLG